MAATLLEVEQKCCRRRLYSIRGPWAERLAVAVARLLRLDLCMFSSNLARSSLLGSLPGLASLPAFDVRGHPMGLIELERASRWS